MFIEQFDWIDIYGYLAAILTTVAFLPQLIRTWKTKSAEDVSFLMLIMFIIGVLFWIVYGLLTKSIPLIIANLLTFALNFSILVLKFAYR